jgi:predicted kinase
MLGYPGAGKTTTAKIIHELTETEHLWADLTRRDMFRDPAYSHLENLQLYEHMNNQAAKLLGGGKSVIFDTSFNFYKDRQRLRELAEENDAEAVVVWVTTPRHVSKDRATDGQGHHTRVFGDMTHERFENLSDKLEEPKPDEKVLKVDGTKVTKEYLSELLSSLQK